MFKHTVVEYHEIDLDELLENLRTDSVIIETLSKHLSPTEYSFIVDCVNKQIQTIKEYTPMPIEGEE